MEKPGAEARGRKAYEVGARKEPALIRTWETKGPEANFMACQGKWEDRENTQGWGNRRGRHEEGSRRYFYHLIQAKTPRYLTTYTIYGSGIEYGN